MSENITKDALAISHILGEIDRIKVSLDEVVRTLGAIDGNNTAIKFDDGDTKIEDIKAVATNVLKVDGGREYFLQVLRDHGAKKLSELKPCDYANVLKGLKSWLQDQKDIPF